MTSTNVVVGADIGGSHITTGLVDIGTRSFIAGSENRIHINSKGCCEAILEGWASAINTSIKLLKGKPALIGIAMPGPFDYCRGISLMKEDHKYGSLYNVDVKTALADLLKISTRQLKFRNDAEAFLEGEVFCGAAVGCKNVVGITLGTGLGSATWKDDYCEDASLWNSPMMDGIAEDYISTRWFLKKYEEVSGGDVKDVKWMAENYNEDVFAREVFAQFSYNLATFLKRFIKVEHTDMVVVGGNIAKAFGIIKPLLSKHLDPTFYATIQGTQLGELSAVIGAACLWHTYVNEVV